MVRKNTKLVPHQLVCLEHQNTYLYGEVIQVISQRNLCWVRPILLVISLSASPSLLNPDEVEKLVDLRSGSDLLLPINLFRVAFDTEIISLLSELDDMGLCSETEARQCLHHFIYQISQAYQEMFKVS